MSMAQTAHSQFEQAYQLVVAINGPLARNEAWDVARELLREGSISVTGRAGSTVADALK